MVNIDALINALPVSGLEPAWIAFISGIASALKDQPWRDSIHLLEPPASGRTAYIDPIEIIEMLLRREGIGTQIAHSCARDTVVQLRKNTLDWEWVVFFDEFDSETPECLPVNRLVEWLRNEWPQTRRRATADTPSSHDAPDSAEESMSACAGVVDFLERAADVAVRAPMFHGPDNWQSPYSLVDRPALTPPKALIEFVPGPPWGEVDEVCESETSDTPLLEFLRWRETVRPIAQALEESLGEPVYYFADLDDELDDDAVHRFLVLHWCCSWQPESPLVHYLIESSGARDVYELKAALIDPASYKHPFEMNDAFLGLEPIPCRFEYPPQKPKTVGFVFSTPEAREAAFHLLQQQIGADTVIIAPRELLGSAWIDRATTNCRSWSILYMMDQTMQAPVSVLAQVDRLCVIANRQREASTAFDLQLSEPVQDLLWLAIQLEMDTCYCTPDRVGLWNPEISLEQRGVPARVAARLAIRNKFTRSLNEIRLDCDYCSSGLWDEFGRNLSYDNLDLPFPLIRRIAAWQKDFDETVTPPDHSDGAWWQCHEREEMEIAQALRTALKGQVKVVP